jgi:macrolide-specific efflux system membrane fusion protein
VVVQVAGQPAGFHAGASASVAIAYHTVQNTIIVPTLAVTQTNGQSTVVVWSNGKGSRRNVETGLVSAGQIEITSGLRVGEQVAVTIRTQAAGNGSGSGSNGGTNGRQGNFGGGGGRFPGGGGGPQGGFGGAGQ